MNSQADSPSKREVFSGPVIVACLAGVKLVLHLAAAANYGLFVDELYFFACGEHLAWGYVDMPPLTAAQAWLARALFGDSLYGIHLLPALAGAALVLLVGVIARELGGGRYAQGLAALAALVAPGYLATDAYLSMNSIEPVLVAGCVLIIIRIIKTGNTKLWLAFGLLAGIGLLNKHTIILFAFAVIASLLVTPQRRIMFNWWFVAAGAIAFVIWLPNLLWMWQHHFPHLEQLGNIKRNHRNVSLSPLVFIAQQVLFMQPAVLPIWLAGLWYFLFGNEVRSPAFRRKFVSGDEARDQDVTNFRLKAGLRNGKRFRALGIAYLIPLVVLIAADSRAYYLLPAYSMLLAGGAVAIEKWLTRSSLSRPSLSWLRLGYVGLIAISGMLFAPLAMPLLSSETYIKYTETLRISPPRIENRGTSALPQLFADRFGWPEMAQAVANAYNQIPEPERKKTAIFGQDYGQAGAIDFYGPKLGLPKAISGHLTYWYWGPREYTGEIMLVMGDRREVLEQKFEQVEKVGEVGHPYAMRSQHWELFLCRRPKGFNLQESWPQLKNWN